MQPSGEPIALADLGVDDDPGSSWHPRGDKANAYLEDGLLPDLNDREVDEHAEKPEAEEQLDGVRRRRARGDVELAAEDSMDTDEGVV